MRIYLDPLAAEAVPDGTFGGARQRRAPDHVTHPTHPMEAARRRAILLAELRERDATRKRQKAA